VDVPETQRLVRAALEGEQADLGALLERMRPRLVLWCAARMSPALRSNLDPEDAAQDILLAVHRDFHQYSGPPDKRFFGWLFTVAENKMRDLVDYYGAKKRQRGEPSLSFSQTSPSQAAARREMVARMHDAIGRLSEDHRTVIRLRKLEDRDVPEVATIMARSDNAVRILYCRALKELRDVLGGASPGTTS
jgi:RNA polymerase sigma-70 factor, ECF subfamily